MKLAVMQPYFFPYIGYFQLIQSVDRFMFFDEVQYVRKSWMSRNKLLNISSNKAYFIRPSLIKVPHKGLLTSVRFDEQDNWKKKLTSQMEGYKNKAPFYDQVMELMSNILSNEYKYLKEFNISSIIQISKWLNLETEFEKYSDFEWKYDRPPNSGEWGLEISKKLKADHYINSPGGENFICSNKFDSNRIKLGFIQPELNPYKQGVGNFVPGLSIIDVLFFNGRDETQKLIRDYTLKWKN